MSRLGIGGHQTAAGGSDTWLTPPAILAALGPLFNCTGRARYAITARTPS